MTPNESQEFNLAPDIQNDSAQIKRKLAWRMGIAGLMIVVLLGGLSLFDYLASEMEETQAPPPRFTEPVPVPKKSVTEASGPLVQAPAPEPEPEPVPDAEKEEEKPVVSPPEPSEVPPGAIAASPPASTTTTNAANNPAPPAAAANPSPAIPAATSPRTPATPTTRQPSRSTPARPAASPPTPSGWTDQSGSPPELTASRPSPSRPNAPGKVDETPVRIVTRQPSMLSRLPSSGYTYQAGVFADQQRAEDVYAKLVLEGIPATLETRVLVGPFRNRNEAEAARARMKALGIDALPIPRGGKK